ncbi:MAG TPA: hemerythrin domain-containing protein [Azospirillaceae bacterium]|nr:hemerythrin domain-containing protein [Azospirillaceae bacterium]
MRPTDNYRRQHTEITTLLEQLHALLLVPQPAAGDSLAATLRRLTGKLTVHLAMEDQSLYPRLLQSPDARIAATAARFQQEMSGIREAFQQFLGRWTDAAIQADRAGFSAALDALSAVLSRRIERENTELYPLLDNAA